MRNQHTRLLARRCGYTLLELAIVLAILTVFATLSWPVITKPWQRSEVQQAAETIREAMSEARIAAINDGLIYQFRWKANADEYEVVSRDPVAKPPVTNLHSGSLHPTPMSESTMRPDLRPDMRTDNGVRSQMPNLPQRNQLHAHQHGMHGQRFDKKRLVKGRLPTGNVFFDSRAVETAFFTDDYDQAGNRREFVPRTNGRPGDEQRQRHDRMHAWRSIDFYPDGRSHNSKLTIRNSNTYEVELELRGLIATVAMGRPRRVTRQDIDLNDMDAVDTDVLANEIVPEADSLESSLESIQSEERR